VTHVPIQSFQSRTLDAIAAKIETYSLEVSEAHAWGNIGNLFVHRKGVVTPVMTIHYNFQSHAYTLSITVGTRKVPSQVGRSDYFDFHHDPVTSSTRFWECLESELGKLAQEHRSSLIAAGMDAKEKRVGRVR